MSLFIQILKKMKRMINFFMVRGYFFVMIVVFSL